MEGDSEAIIKATEALSAVAVVSAKFEAHEDSCARGYQENARAMSAVWNRVDQLAVKLDNIGQKMSDGFEGVNKTIFEEIGNVNNAVSADSRDNRKSERAAYIAAIMLLISAVSALVFYMLTHGRSGG